MESWRKVWRTACELRKPDGSYLLPTAGLEWLAKAIRNDSAELIQGATTSPPPLQCVQDWPVEAACLIGCCGWKGLDLPNVNSTEEYFSKVCFNIDQAMSEPASVRFLLNWFDETPREEMRRLLLPEVLLALESRQSVVAGRA